MAERAFTTGVGFAIDQEENLTRFSIIYTTGIPGDVTNTAVEALEVTASGLGSFAIDNLTGLQYRRKTTGTGTTPWIKVTDQDDIDALNSGIHWRPPVAALLDVANTLAASYTDALNNGVDGTTLTNGDRILLNAVTDQPKDVYIFDTGTGAFVADTHGLHAGDRVFINEGTDYAGCDFSYESTGAVWNKSGQSSLDELGFLRAFVGKTASGTEVPNYSSATVVSQGSNLETAIGALDAQVNTNTTDIGTVTTTASNLQTEVDAIETALGGMISAAGAYVPHTGTTFIDGNASVTEDLTDLDAAINAAGTSAEEGFIRDFIGKGAAGAETPSYASSTYAIQNSSLEAAIGFLDAQLILTEGKASNNETEATNLQNALGAAIDALGNYNTAAFSATNYLTGNTNTTQDLIDLDAQIKINELAIANAASLRTNTQAIVLNTYTTVDSVLTDEIGAVSATITVDQGINSKRIYEVTYGHNALGGNDATDSDLTVYAKMKIGNLGPCRFQIVFTGTGATQAMELQVRCSQAATVKLTFVDVAA